MPHLRPGADCKAAAARLTVEMEAPLAFNSNLHPAETVSEIIEGVLPLARAVRERLGWQRIGLDLRLGSRAIAELAAAAVLARLRRACDAAGVVISTINAFPLAPFQAERVKDRAYAPDWTQPGRLADSLACIDLALALADHDLLTISTVPGSFKPWGRPANDHARIAAALVAWVRVAAERCAVSGRRVMLCLEPEPWCTLEHSVEVVDFWQQALLPAAAGLPIAEHLGICFDTCHCSLAFEQQQEAVERLRRAGIAIGKCQFSAALEVALPDPAGLSALAAMAEPRFLHQCAARSAAGSLVKVSDLDQLDDLLGRLPAATCVRSHFHVPVFWPPQASGLSTTIRDSQRGLAACHAAGCRQFAVETYTWSVLAAEERDIVEGCTREMQAMSEILAITASGSGSS
jgi:sugar phosphate isomerase/epimerase